MSRWIGLLGSWALFVLGLGVACIAAAGGWINVKDSRRLRRHAVVDQMLSDRLNGTVAQLRRIKTRSESALSASRSEMTAASAAIDEPQATPQTIVVSTVDNKVYVRSNKRTVFTAVCSTGKHTTLVENGRVKIFRTPVGKFKVRSKEENPVWIPPDWHYAEEARKKGLAVVRLDRGGALDAETGGPARRFGGGVWDWVGSSGGSRRILTVENDTVVETAEGVERELPAGVTIVAGRTVVIPPIGTPQRRVEKVLGAYRINLGDGYALHGTQSVAQLGRSVSHGCVRLGAEDIAELYRMAHVGDEVIIY
ncbi:MAG: L,D-transpeptidase [Elusimicrobia bacterium]|nr:L,D-transpeptidase [Elusimicrobiota bacterium]